MAKLCGAFWTEAQRHELTDMAVRMLDAIAPAAPTGRSVTHWPAGAVAAQAVNSSEHTPAGVEAPNGLVLVLAGEHGNARDLADRYGLELPAGRESGAELLAALAAAKGPALLGDLNGVGVLVWHDPAGEEVIVAHDRYGFCPLYYYWRDGLLLVASECKAICAVAEGLSEDAGAYGDFFYAGYLMGNRTLFRQVKALGPGEYLQWRSGRLERKRYWDSSAIDVRDAADVSVPEVCELFDRAVARRIQPDARDTLLLSGGLDSRLILGAMLDNGCRPALVTLANKAARGGMEGRLALELAARADLPCDVRTTREGFFESARVLDAFHVHDGMVPTFGLFISQAYAEIDESMGRVWDGLALDVALGGHVQFGGGVRDNLGHLLPLRATHRRFMRKLFRPDWFDEIETRFQAGLAAELESVDDSEDGWVRLLLKNRTRRRVGMNPHQLYSRKIVPLTPGVDAEFMDYMLSVPSQRRLNRRLYMEVFAYGYPDLMKVPAFSEGQYFEFRKLDGTLRREVAEKPGTWKRYAHALGLAPLGRALYTGLMGINPGEMAGLSPGLVLKLVPRALERDLYDREYLETAIRKLRKGSLYWLTPLSIVFYVELWRLLFREGQYASVRRDVFGEEPAGLLE